MGCQMQGFATDSVTLLARLAGLHLGDEAGAVSERLAQLLGFARELDGLVLDDVEIDAVFDPTWDTNR